MENKSSNEITRIIKFIIFSISAGLIQIVSFTIMSEVFSLTYWPSYLIALILSIVWNFTINRKFTFKSANNCNVESFRILCCFYSAINLLGWCANKGWLGWIFSFSWNYADQLYYWVSIPTLLCVWKEYWIRCY